jgi:hypothetical protein
MPRALPMHRCLAIATVLFFILLSYYHESFSATFKTAYRETPYENHDKSEKQVAQEPLEASKPAASTPEKIHLEPISDVDDAAYLRDLLKKNNAELKIHYMTRTIRYIPDAKERLSMTNTSQELFPKGYKSIDLEETDHLPADNLEPLEIHVTKSPRPEEIDASELLFGVSTTYKRFSDENEGPVKEWVRWLTNGNGSSNGAGLVLQLHETTDQQIVAAQKLLTSLGIAATVMQSDPSLDMPGRYVDLVPILYSHPTRASRKYLALIDDDTFFPNLDSLMHELHKYDHRQEYYIGTLTERVDFIMHDRVPMVRLLFHSPASKNPPS